MPDYYNPEIFSRYQPFFSAVGTTTNAFSESSYSEWKSFLNKKKTEEYAEEKLTEKFASKVFEKIKFVLNSQLHCWERNRICFSWKLKTIGSFSSTPVMELCIKARKNSKFTPYHVTISKRDLNTIKNSKNYSSIKNIFDMGYIHFVLKPYKPIVHRL